MFPQHVYRGIYSENVSPRGNDSKPPLLYQIYEEPIVHYFWGKDILKRVVEGWGGDINLS